MTEMDHISNVVCDKQHAQVRVFIAVVVVVGD